MERPIIMNGESVRAILEGRKTQTRRVIPHKLMQNADLDANDPTYIYFTDAYGDSHHAKDCAPYRKNDLLWVKETWAAYKILERSCDGSGYEFAYKADGHDTVQQLRYHISLLLDVPLGAVGIKNMRYHSPVTMPKDAARIWLRVTDVRAERLQDITEAGAIAEGALHGVDASWGGNGAYAQGRYQFLWDMHNAKRGFPWKDNPWVWVYDFKLERVVK